jgi:alkylhydroperoxidase family enzyme
LKTTERPLFAVSEANICNWARLRVAQLRCSSIGIRQHWNDLLQCGEAEDKLNRLADWHYCWLFSEKERLALGLAEALTLDPAGNASLALLHGARVVFPRPIFFDLVAAIQSVNEWNDGPSPLHSE